MTVTSARPGPRRLSPRSNATTGRVVVGIDGSQSGWRALRWAADEAHLRSALLEVVLAFDVSVPTVNLGLAAVDSPATDKVIDERAQAAVRDVSEGGLITHSLALPGRPGPVLSRMAEGADLLVVGSRGHGTLRNLVLGSTAEFCLHHAKCPVVIVPDHEME